MNIGEGIFQILAINCPIDNRQSASVASAKVKKIFAVQSWL